MANLVQVKCDEVNVWIEPEGEIVSGKRTQKVSVSESMKKTMISFEKISDTIKAYCTSLVKTFKEIDIEYAPDKIKAEFGLKISAEGNVFVVKSAAEGSINITAEWEMK